MSHSKLKLAVPAVVGALLIPVGFLLMTFAVGYVLEGVRSQVRTFDAAWYPVALGVLCGLLSLACAYLAIRLLLGGLRLAMAEDAKPETGEGAVAPSASPVEGDGLA